MSIVYADELFVLNMAIDYFLLLRTAKLCSLPYRRVRYAVAAGFGALWCCLGLWPAFAWLDSPWMKLVLALGMCLCAFGRERRLARHTAVFLGLSFLLGGAVWALGLWRGTWRPGGRFIRLDLRVLLLSFALCWAGITLVFRRRFQHAERRIHPVTLTRKGRDVTLRALRDTGNELRDPLTGRHVLVADADTLAPLFTAEEAAALRGDAVSALAHLAGFRLIPYSALSGGGLLLCFSPDGMSLDGEAVRDIAVAVTPGALDRGGDYDAIL